MKRSMSEAWAAPGFDSPTSTAPWSDAFLVDGSRPRPIPLLQQTATAFELEGTLKFTGDMGLEKYTDIDDAVKEGARSIDGADLGLTDLASIPSFVRWFVDPYGRYTPAALIHDHLIIGGRPNAGLLGSDTAADRYWRYMLRAVGVPLTKRWIMWAATALRTRWAVKGIRRLSVIAWVVLATAGIATAVVATIALFGGGDLPGDVEPGAVLAFALALPLAASALWGKQYGAGLVAAGAAIWLLPPSIIAIVGYAIYWVIERACHALGWT